MHLTESCDEGLPNLITNVRTNCVASATDVKQLRPIQEGLERSGLLPAEQLADAAYVSASNLVRSGALRIDLVGPPYQDTSWQAKAKEGFDKANYFRVDWQKKTVICPRGRESSQWCETTARARGQSMVHVEFLQSECAPCPSRPSCTRAKNLPRTLTPQPKEEHEAIRSARKRQRTPEFASTYSRRAGIEGTISQGVRAFGLRRARYRGLKRTNLQELGTAAALNVSRLTDWLGGIPTAATRRSRFVALAPAS